MGSGKIESGIIHEGWLPDYLSQEIPTTPWLVDPFLPQGSIVFFHGPTSVGKSPFTWKLAHSVATGEDFFGYPVASTGPVLYLEFDTPSVQVIPRMQKIPGFQFVRNFFVANWAKPLNIIDPTPADTHKLHELARNVAPVLVVVNTLRKVHALDDRNSDVPARVYGAWRKFFPDATLLFVHHDRKAPTGALNFDNPDQAFSGSQHWVDDAQVALHITRQYESKEAKKKEPKPEGDEPRYEKTRVQVKMTKSQVSDHEAYKPLELQLSEDGTNWNVTGQTEYRKYFLALDPRIKRSARIKMTMERFDKSDSTIHAAVQGFK